MKSAFAILFAFAVAAAVAMVGYLVMKGPSPREPVPGIPAPIPETGKTDPTPKPAPGAGKKKPPKEPAPLEPAVPATREGRLAFLQRFAGPAAPPKDGRMIFLFPAVRADALEALENLPGHDASPLVLAALGGDGNPEAWGEDRLVAAGIRTRQGHPDGPETVRAFLKSEEDLSVADGLGAAARAAGWMGKEGGPVVQRLLSLDLEDLDEEDLAEFLRAAAVLGDGATKENLVRFVAAEEGKWEPLVLGAASGALLRQGDPSGRKVLDALKDDDWFGAEDFALGLGARGNAAAVPWLKELLGADSEWTQSAAAAALAVVGGDEAKAALRAALADPADEVSGQAAVSLALLGDRSGVEKVRLAAQSKDPDLAIPAWKALALLGDEGWKPEAEKLLSTPWPSAADARSAPETRKRVWAALLMLKLEGDR